MMLFVVVSIFAYISSGNACCAPDQWEGDMGLMIATVNGGNRSFIEGTQHISYDAVNKMMTLKQNLNVEDNTVTQTIITDFNKGQVYIANSDGSCSTHASEPFTKSCVPDDAVGTRLVYGLGSNSLQAMSYQYTEANSQVYMIVTADTCVPVALDTTTKNGASESIAVYTTAAITAGIADRNVFNIPAACSTTNVGPVLPGLGKRSVFF